MSEDEYFHMPSLPDAQFRVRDRFSEQGTITFTDKNGRPVLIIDPGARTINVPEGVVISEAAEAVFEGVRGLLGWTRITNNEEGHA